jgi:type I restriction enzyme S subunit
MVNIAQSAILNMPIAVPPTIQEMRVIASTISALRENFDKLCGEAKRAIDFLKERRSALISSAVTGKIDVRSIAPAEMDAAA